MALLWPSLRGVKEVCKCVQCFTRHHRLETRVGVQAPAGTRFRARACTSGEISAFFPSWPFHCGVQFMGSTWSEQLRGVSAFWNKFPKFQESLRRGLSEGCCLYPCYCRHFIPARVGIVVIGDLETDFVSSGGCIWCLSVL